MATWVKHSKKVRYQKSFESAYDVEVMLWKPFLFFRIPYWKFYIRVPERDLKVGLVMAEKFVNAQWQLL